MSIDKVSSAAALEASVGAELPGGLPQALYPPFHSVAGRSSTGPGHRLGRRPAPPPDWATPLGDALPLKDFLRDLEREKRRSDRSKAPLSMALYQLDDDARHTVAFLEIVHKVTRETDVVGHVGNDMLALLCPDTDASGIRSVLRKIDEHAKDFAFRTVAAVTHPDLLLDKISQGELTRDTATTADGSTAAIQFAPAFVSDRPERNDAYALKRFIDVSGALAAAILLSPLMLLTGLAVALTSPGPIIFRQTRLGQGGKPFTFYKFRSMFVGGDDRVHRAYVASLIDGDADRREGSGDSLEQRLYKLTSDPRITAVGRFIRKTSIDELPQLFNVLRGDMSLVGPRPPIPYEAARYKAWHLRRLQAVKPGITGLWQVEGRSKVSFDEMVRMDLRYIRDYSLELDLRILLKTVKVVLRCEGAA